MTEKKDRTFGLKSNGIIIAESGRYGTTDIIDSKAILRPGDYTVIIGDNELPNVETGVDMAIKTSWYKRFFQAIIRGVKWFFS